MTPVEGAGRHIDTPVAFAGDEGAADPRLAAALGQGRGDAVLAVLTEGVRLLVPIVAVRDDVDADGADTSSHMASVSLVQPDGRRGMLAFTSLETMRAWDPTARPVPVRACDVAAAALAEGADGVLVDIAGPIRFALDGESLHRVAESA
ncbi:MAG: SseB family protein [Candidatus Nanopelagicales bacterium]|nr:SseB family protein [Candidatus Nanopelagicales bacterium]MDP4715770.1 SseB family protein [Candidatus Nanopelagicales bacterium]MDP4975004.1 SseB family protein [Candidatus Nanopelagicales bacterium]